MLRELLAERGNRNPPRNPALLAVRAFHTTSDFPLLLSAAANKMLLAAYQPAQPPTGRSSSGATSANFKPHRHLRVGDFPTLLPLLENGEIQVRTMSESQEIAVLQTFARRIRVTRPVLVNDDLGAFTDFSAAIGRCVAEFENATAYRLVNSGNGDGPTLTTGNATVFGTAAARANKAAAGSALDLAGLAARRAAITHQKTLDGLPISIGSTMRLLVGANDGAVDDQVFEVGVIRHGREDAVPDALRAPAPEPTRGAVPRPERLWQVAPGRARPHDPQHRLDEHPVVAP